jgi:SAM-dependent methyltransferase
MNYWREKILKQSGILPRDQNGPTNLEYADRFWSCFPKFDLSVLDVGCGFGWRTLNFLRKQYSAYGLDHSDYCYFNSVLPVGRHFCSDLLSFQSRVSRQWQIINCERVLEHLPVFETRNAFNALNALSTDYVVLSVICMDHSDPMVVEGSRAGILNLNKKDFWVNLAKEYGWVLDKPKTDIMTAGGWDCIWVFRKPGCVLNF